jgi:hypothetical protein
MSRPRRRIRWQEQRPQQPNPILEHRDRPVTTDPLGDHRRRHRRHDPSNNRICGSTPSTIEARAARSYFGGPADANARRIALRDDPVHRTIALIGNPSAR